MHHYFWLGLCALVALAACSDVQEEFPKTIPTPMPDMLPEPDADACAPSGPPECPGDVGESGVCLPLPPALPDLTPPGGCSTTVSEEGSCLPAPPQPLRWVCPEGWDAVPSFGPEQLQYVALSADLKQQHHCQPPELPEACPAGTGPRLGDGECVALGLDCPVGDAPWHSEDTLRSRVDPSFDGALIHVLPGAEDGGAGTVESPFATISQAMGAASEGDIVVAGVGNHGGPVNIDVRVALIGACAARTALSGGLVIDSSQGAWVGDLALGGEGPGMTIEAGSAGVRVQSVHVAQAAEVGVRVSGASSVVFEDLLISDTIPGSDMTGGQGLIVERGAGLTAVRVVLTNNRAAGLSIDGEGTVVEATDLVVAHTQARSSDQLEGAGVRIAGGARLVAEGALVTHNHSEGLALDGEGTVVEATDLVVAHTQSQASDGTRGLGAFVTAGAHLRLTGALLMANRASTLVIQDEGSLLEATDLVVADTQPHASDGRFGQGMTVQAGGAAILERALLSNNHRVGLAISNAGPVEAIDLVVIDTQLQQSSMTEGNGIGASGSGAQVLLTRVLSIGNHTIGVALDGPGVRAVLTDMMVAQTRPSPVARGTGRSLNIGSGAQVEGERVFLTDHHAFGMLVYGEDTLAKLSDLVITQPESSSASAIAVIVQLMARFEGERVFITRSGRAGIYTDRPSLVKVSDLHLTHTQPTADGEQGRGVVVQAGARFEGDRVLLEHNRDVGLYIQGAEASVRDLVVEHTLPQAANMEAGRGISAQPGAVLDLERVRLAHNHEAGLASLLADEVSATDLTITDTLPRASDMAAGRGISQLNGSFRMDRVLLARNREIGLHVLGGRAQTTASELTIRDTLPLPDNTGGLGLAIFSGAEVTVDAFSITGNALSGIAIGEEGHMRGSAGHVADNFIGLNVLTEDFDYDALVCVDIRDNCCGQSCEDLVCNVESLSIPVPDALETLETLDDLGLF